MLRMGRIRGREETRAAFKQANREIRQVARGHVHHVIQTRVVPTANAMAPSVVKGTMAPARRQQPALTTNARGKRRAIVAVLNFGGTIRAPITPKRAKALRFDAAGGEVFTMKVTAPRKIKGKRFMEAAAGLHRRTVMAVLAREVPRAVQAHIDRSATFIRR